MADGSRPRSSLLQPGVNCWQRTNADRVALLVDGERYFAAFAAAAERARRSILILAWDFNSQTFLRCDGDQGQLPLGDFLNSLARRRRWLDVRVLIWDYPMIFGTDREFPPLYGLGWKPHRRVRLRYDNTHPIAGSHHQKVVVIDDRVAFCGGLDLTTRRWDTCAHSPRSEQRKVGDVPYPPFHDIMMMVEGETARSLGTLARERWRLATGRRLRPPRKHGDPWPADVEPRMTDATVAISRTLPAGNSHPAVREVEALYLDQIAAARRYIYIENQYFTSQKLGDALMVRLAEEDGPEVVVVLRLLSHGWLEEVTMQNLRRGLIDRLQKADRFGHLHVYYPFIEGLEEGTCIDIHSKVLIVDDEWLRVGSTNFSNRSMGFDSECDLTLEAGGRPEVMREIRGFRDQLLAEHLGVEETRVSGEIAANGSISATIGRLQSPQRTLKALENEEAPGAVMSLASLADPEQPVTVEQLVAQFAPRAALRVRGAQWLKVAAVALLVAALAGVWQLAPIADVLTPERITSWAREFGATGWAPLIVLAAYTPAALIMFPRPLITLFAVIAFGPWLGFGCAMTGILISALVTYVIGMRMDRSMVRRLAGPSLHRCLDVLRRRGIVAMTALRLVPLAPFPIEGILAGAIRIKLLDFMIGTALGMLPGTLTTTVFGDQLQVALHDPRQVNLWLIAGVVLVLVVASLLVRRWLLTTQTHEKPASR